MYGTSSSSHIDSRSNTAAICSFAAAAVLAIVAVYDVATRYETLLYTSSAAVQPSTRMAITPVGSSAVAAVPNYAAAPQAPVVEEYQPEVVVAPAGELPKALGFLGVASIAAGVVLLFKQFTERQVVAMSSTISLKPAPTKLEEGELPIAKVPSGTRLHSIPASRRQTSFPLFVANSAEGLQDAELDHAKTGSSSLQEATYHFLVANAKFMLFDEEHGMELLREKRRFLREKGLPQDFWIVPEPEFLAQLPDIDKRVLKPSCALVSTDEKWILFMKLRYDKVLMGSFKGPSDPKKALATKGGNPLAVVPKWEVPADWVKTVPYPKYADDWFHPFLVEPPK